MVRTYTHRRRHWALAEVGIVKMLKSSLRTSPLNKLRAKISSLKALADLVRLEILKPLSHGELCVCGLNAVLDVPQLTLHITLGASRERRLSEGGFYSVTRGRGRIS